VLIESLLHQVYGPWEVDFVGGHVADAVKATVAGDSRFRFSDPTTVTHAVAWNDALRSAQGSFLVVVEPDLILRPHALFHIAATIERHPDCALIYADEDEIDEDGTRSHHDFKPDWNEALLYSQNYLGALIAIRRDVAVEAGGCMDERDGDCVWGLVLRVSAGAADRSIQHVPFVLSHRHVQGPQVHAQSREAHQERLARVGQDAELRPVGASNYQILYALPRDAPSVSVIVPSTCNPELLGPCLEGVLNRSSYPDLEVILVVNEIQTRLIEVDRYLDGVAGLSRLRVLFHENRPFNFSWVNNWAVNQTRAELVCFLNDDTEVITADWLDVMVGHVLQERVAAVGAMLYYPDDTIQHAGVVVGAGGIAAHNYRGSQKGSGGYHYRALVPQDVTCVTGACMLVRRHVFVDIGGFDEALGIAFNDVDFCLRLRASGWRIVWTPSAELYHKESRSIGRHDLGERQDEWERARRMMTDRWSEELLADPYYSFNLSLDPLQLWEPAFPPRVAYPWKVATTKLRPAGGTAVSAGAR
jgi:hypothetical protein